jgi:hypothetical protein
MNKTPNQTNVLVPYSQKNVTELSLILLNIFHAKALNSTQITLLLPRSPSSSVFLTDISHELLSFSWSSPHNGVTNRVQSEEN